MDLQPTIIQAAIAIPVTTAFVVYMLLRERSTLNVLVAFCLGSAIVWMTCVLAGRLLPAESSARLAMFHLELFSIAVMPPLFIVTMGVFARIPAFERGYQAGLSLALVSAAIYAAYWLDSDHQWFVRDLPAALRGEHPTVWAGPVYWSLQLWSTLGCTLAIGMAARVWLRGRTRVERKRALMILGAILTPLAAHLLYMSPWTPFDFTLATGAMAPSAFFFIRGVTRYGLFLDQSLVRQDIIDHFHDGVILADTDGLVLDANRAAEGILSVPNGALCGLSLAQALSPLDPDGAEERVGLRIASLPMRGRFTEEIRTSDGRAVEITAGAVAALGSQPAGRFVSLRDRSEQRRSERLLQEKQKLESVGILAAGVAHEVNNPLAFVRSNLAHLQRLAEELEKELEIGPGSAGSDLLEFPEILGESVEGIDRIGRIVDGMLQFSRMPEEGGTTVCVNGLVQDALRLGALRRTPDVHVEQDLDGGLPDVVGSPQRLVQVILNLLLNAKQALEGCEDGRISVVTSNPGDCVEIRISDNGPGIPEEHRSQIFDPFFTTRSPGQGTGLGLSIASDIVHEHDGLLECQSEPGGGTRFTIRLPIHDNAER